MDTTGLGKWRAMLGFAALYNLAIGGAALVSPGSVDSHVGALLVICFGLVYALTARDPLRLAPVLWAGVIGKLGVIALVWPQVRAGAAVPGTGAVLAGDAVFTLLFLAFLYAVRKASR